ncbi:MAG: hypothetical protein NTX22_13120 [Ignavibacteriales bacterium]|nr:hypothetical protein [Ignavibacteriales bacterium]
MKSKFIVYILITFLALANLNLGQVVIKELGRKDVENIDSVSFGGSKLRKTIDLNGRWDVYLPNEFEKRKSVTVPSSFTGEEVLVYEKNLNLDPVTISENHFRLVFNGINYSAEIMLNYFVIYKHSGGDYPIKIDLPKDILKTKGKNILTVKVFHQINSDESIPVEQRLLFPENFGGIARNVFLEVMPKVFLSGWEHSYNVSGTSRANLNINAKFINNNGINKSDTLSNSNSFSCRLRLVSPTGEEVISNYVQSFILLPRKEKNLSMSFDLNNLQLWSPQNPRIYKLTIQLVRNDVVIDEIIKPISFYSLQAHKDSLTLNGHSFTLNGVTYYASYVNNGNLASYQQMKEDVKIIKSIGFNAIRFAKGTPDPVMLNLCEEFGLLALIELPLNSIPTQICWNANFKERVKSFLIPFINSYKEYGAVAAVGLGSSYVSNSFEQAEFLKELGAITKMYFNKLTFASFVGYNITQIENVDFYGIEIVNKQLDDFKLKLENVEHDLGKGKVFISEATYASYSGSTNGYLNPFSYEAQAKFYSDLLDFCIDNNRSGYFINSIFDFRGDYSSLISGFNQNNIYRIGILGEDRELNRISQKVIYSKLHSTEKVTIPIGSKKDDAPMVFILFGMALALLLGFLINSKRKFREDASRALLRPYNFFSDVRDQRILSGFHSNFLMLMLSGTSALLLSNLLFYFRGNILLEKIVLAFGMPSLIKAVSYLAWNPLYAIIWLTVISIFFLIITTLLVKIASFFVRNQVFFSSVYFTVTWSFLPLLLLLPLGLILYKVLNAEFVTVYLLIALVVFTVWIYYRLMKGIYVIFDVSSGTVYFYSIIFIVVTIVGVLLYFQISNSTVYYLLNSFKQYSVM